MAEADDQLVRAVCRAITGADVDLPEATTGALPATRVADAPPATRVVDALAAAGWTGERLQGLRRSRQDDELPWPFPVDPALVRPAGFARYGAVLCEVRASLGLDGLVPTVHQGPKVIGPAELRLLAEVPPHHGNVG